MELKAGYKEIDKTTGLSCKWDFRRHSGLHLLTYFFVVNSLHISKKKFDKGRHIYHNEEASQGVRPYSQCPSSPSG